MRKTEMYFRLRILSWAMLCSLLTMQAFAQVHRVTGYVTTAGAGSEPLPGVTVTVKGTNRMAVTDERGRFAIDAAGNEVLVVTSVGYSARELRVGNGANLAIQLQPSSSNLNEVVVIGYGKMKRADLSSAQVSISSADIGRTVNTSLEQAIQGRAAGVYVTQNSGQPGGGISVNIRGINSISTTTQPLYVIDGVQMQQSVDVSYGSTASSNPLAFLNPNDIESIDVLQGPSATAIYGSRGTNGVVLITTKHGRAGQLRLSYNYLYSIQDKPKELSTMTLPQYAQMENEFRKQQTGGTGRPEFADPSLLGPGTDWQYALFKRAPLQKHQLSLSGGSNATTFYLSGEYFNQEGVAIGSKFERASVRLNLDNSSLKWLKLSTNLNFNQTKEKLGATSENVISNALTMAPNVAVIDAKGNWGGPDATNGNSVQYSPLNPVAIANLVQNNLKKYYALGGINADINIIKGLVFRTSLNASANWAEGKYFTPSYQLGSKTNSTASLSLNNSTNTYWNLNELLQYNTEIGKHNIGAMVSHESQESRYSGISGSRTGFTSNDVVSLPLGSTNPTNSSYQGSWAMESYLGRVTYSYDDKYILQGAFRADGSVFFAPNNRWGYFPSASAAWRVSQEPFMRDLTFITELKLRFETGATGNQGNDVGYYARLATNTTPWGTGFFVSRFANPGLKWESTNTNNVGINLGMFQNRVQLEADYYVKKTDNLIMQLPLPAYLGAQGNGSTAAPFVNIGALENRGYAITLNTVNIDKGGFTWKSNFNISHFNTELTKLYSNTAVIDRQPWYIGTGSDAAHGFLERSVIGQAPWLMYGYIQEGLFQSTDEIAKSAVPTKSDGKTRLDTDPSGVWVGDVKYRDLNGDGIIDFKDQTIIGNPWPKYTMGFTNDFQYKGFDLSVLLTSSVGNDVYNFNRFVNTQPNNINLGRNLLSETFNYAKFSGTGPDTKLANPGTIIPRISNGDPNGNAQRITNAFIEDGSYVKIKNVTLSYSFPKRWVSKLHVVQGLHAAIGVQNLATFTKYKGYDPEVGAYVGQNVGTGDQLIGVDAGRYPLTRTYTFNVGVDF